jgi:hypothetical protein
MLLKIQALWDAMCHWASGSQHFRGTQCLPLQTKAINLLSDAEDEGATMLQIANNWLAE